MRLKKHVEKTGSLALMFTNLWMTNKVLRDCRKANIVVSLKREKGEPR